MSFDHQSSANWYFATVFWGQTVKWGVPQADTQRWLHSSHCTINKLAHTYALFFPVQIVYFVITLKYMVGEIKCQSKICIISTWYICMLGSNNIIFTSSKWKNTIFSFLTFSFLLCNDGNGPSRWFFWYIDVCLYY